MNVEIRIDPYPGQHDINDLWRDTWEIDGIADFNAVLTRSLVHVGAFIDGTRLVGFANMAWDGGFHAFLVDVCVHPDHRDEGVGQKLVQTIIDIARNRGAKWIHVDFEPHLKPFYLSCGFESTEAGVLKIRS
ncbi:GNAT family N-acetyltransferase [Pelagibacterium montanilacus]|uniref:GNAT family N-acetyltransferase n=1 Tax=Pelagibacterium montanilacus TaxID=2185280 RepID=UPI000F8CC7C3|nr:GNAT family N-acetyltransferase [Pelagibacterium montanilacus]